MNRCTNVFPKPVSSTQATERYRRVCFIKTKYMDTDQGDHYFAFI